MCRYIDTSTHVCVCMCIYSNLKHMYSYIHTCMCIFTSVNIDLYIHTTYRSSLCTYIPYLPIPVSTHTHKYICTQIHMH